MKIFIIAGEPSGDSLGAAVMAGLKELAPEVEFRGVGGPRMQAGGLESLFPMDELSVMGIAEILPQYFHLKRRIRECAEAVLADPPNLLLTIDAPDFNLRVARLVKARSKIRTVHYVAPTVWAWRPKRAEKMAEVIDQVLCLFPFEPPYMERAGIESDFVGHPVVTDPQASEAEAAAFRLAHGLGDAPVLLVLPGSRRGEVTRLAPVLGEVVGRLFEERPEIRPVLPAAGSVAGLVQELTAKWPRRPLILDPRETIPAAFEAEKRAAFRAADVAVAASGTVSLELAAASTPMVIAYRMHPITFRIIDRMRLVDTATLVNLVSDTRVVPEFLGPACQPEPVARAVLDVLAAPGPQMAAMRLSMERLVAGGERPGLRAARAILSRL